MTTAAAARELASAVALASNEQPWGPTPAVLHAVAEAVRRGNRYPDTRAERVRDAIADALAVVPGRVAVGAGSVALLRQLFAAYVRPGDPVVFPWPSFEAYPIEAQLAGAEVRQVPLARCTVDAAGITHAARGARLVLVPTPNNPTGTAVRRGDLLRLADSVPDDCLLVVDEAYREFACGADVGDAITLLGERPNVVVLRTFSKAYGLAAFRVGFLVGAPDVVDAVDKVAVPFVVSAVAQAAALAALSDEAEMRRRVGMLVAERDRVVRTIRSLGLGAPDPQGNFVWLPCGAAADEVTAELERHDVVVRGFAGRGVRVTVGSPHENDAFLRGLAVVATRPTVAEAWELPTGELALGALRWLDRLEAVEARLVAHASRAVPRGVLTHPHAASGEQWDAGQVWAHLAEFGTYWLRELDAVLSGSPARSVPFGRVASNAERIAAVARGRHRPVRRHLAVVLAAIDALRARLAELEAGDWQRSGRHQTLGDLDVPAQLQHFHVGHYEEHADQLDQLVGDTPLPG